MSFGFALKHAYDGREAVPGFPQSPLPHMEVNTGSDNSAGPSFHIGFPHFGNSDLGALLQVGSSSLSDPPTSLKP